MRGSGRLDAGDGSTLVVLKFPGETVGTLELIHRPAGGPVDIGTGFSHLVVQVDELASMLGGDIAVAYWFSRARGALTSGRESGSWVRVTNCCQRSEQGWLVTHEHVSIPVDLSSGTPAMSLEP